MKFLLSLCTICLLTVSAQTQNTGIGTITPQATLDVKGNQRIGGASAYMTFDSLAGEIEWRNSNLYVPVSQRLIHHSAAGDGLFYNNNAPISGQLEYRNASGNPVFYTNFINGNGYFAGNVGIGTTSPLTKLHVFGGASGNPTPQGPLVVEGNSNTYINVISPNAYETAVLFGNASAAASGGIVYNNGSTPNGFQFRNNGNISRMVIDNTGNVGIGTINPLSPLHVNGVSLFSPGGANIQILDGNRIQAYLNDGLNLTTYSDDPIKFTTNTSGGSIGGERMRILSNGNIGLGVTDPYFKADIGGRLRIRHSDEGEPGIWLNDAANTNLQAFIGLENDTYVGFYGSGAGWKFGMNTQTGALKINGTEGTNGQVLTSNAGGSAPAWGFPVKTYQWVLPTYDITSSTETSIFNQNVTATTNSSFIITVQVTLIGSVYGPGAAWVYLYIDGSRSAEMKIKVDGNYANNSSTSLPNFIFNGGTGTHSLDIRVLKDPTSYPLYLIGSTGNTVDSYVSVIQTAR